jgi:hypothetical protein
LDELISSWNELTSKTKENFDKASKQNQENPMIRRKQQMMRKRS